MKTAISLLFAFSALAFSGCTTLSNRRDLWSPQPVDGPYTQMLRDGLPKSTAVSGEAPAGVSGDYKNVVN